MTSLTSDTLNADVAKPTVAAVLVSILLVLLFTVGNLAYVLVPILALNGAFCPTNTFSHEFMDSAGSLVAGFSLSTLCCLGLLLCLAPRQGGKPVFRLEFPKIVNKTFKIMFAIAMLCGVSIAGIIWLNFVQAYSCVTPDNILIRRSAFDPVRSSTWDDVKVVGAHCWYTKYGAASGLVLFLVDGEAIQIPLSDYGSGLQKEYNTIGTALWGKAYRYRPDMSVNRAECPRGVYPYLLEWRGSRY
jgi:hypothetical protein